MPSLIQKPLFLLFGGIALLFTACEIPVPVDMVFCKSEEVFVLATPFKEKSAIIVMYKGDDLRLLGDTAYQQPTEAGVPIDSSHYYVKVKAKRGVVGWVHANDLQRERPKIQTSKPKEPVIIEKIEEASTPVSDFGLLDLDTSIVMTDSLWQLWMGTYQLPKDTSQNSETIRFVCSRRDSTTIQFEYIRTGIESCAGKEKGIAHLTFNRAVFKEDSCALYLLFTPPFLEIQQRKDCMKGSMDCDFDVKLKKMPIKQK